MNCNAHIWLAAALLLFTIGSFTGLAEAQEQATNTTNSTTEGEKADVDQDIAYLTVSGELARLAADSKDPILMLAAARLEAMAATETASRDKTSEGDTAEAEVEPKPEKENLYALAEQYAGTNETLHTLIEDSKASVAGTRGARFGPQVGYDSVLAYRTDVYRVAFRGGEYAEVAVTGDGDTDLDLFIYDENGNLICSDTDYTDRTYCGWSPAWTGTFRIKIENLGGVYNEYRLATN